MSSSEVAPDYLGPLLGWRAWRVVECKGRCMLGSPIKHALWPPGTALTAECLAAPHWLRRLRPHPAPGEKCGCGIYATTLDRIGDYVREPPARRSLGWVIGRVALWGTVVECERGYRASHAYPLDLYVPSDTGRGPKRRRNDLAVGLADYSATVNFLDAPVRDALRLLTPAPHSGVAGAYDL